MPEDPPVSTTVPETVTTDTGADKATVESLGEQFADFWKEADEKEAAVPSSAPEAPGEGAAQETRKETALAESAEPREEPKRETPAPKELTDQEVDDIETPPEWHPKVVEQVKNIKDLWKQDRARWKQEAERAKTLEAQLNEARANSWTPEAKADYEHAAAIRRKYDFVSDPEFIQKFHAPVRSQFENILNEAVEALPDRDSAAAWAAHIAQNYSPDQLDRNWWLNSVIAKVPNEMDRASLLQSVTHLLRMQRERDTEIGRRTNDKSSFDNWITEKAQQTQKRVQEEIMAEIGVQERRIQEVLPRDVAQAKTKEEREAIEQHNERFNRLNTFFQDTMKDISSNGPKAWVRASVEATRAQLLESEYKALEKELKSAKAERDQYKAELDKITGARRRISSSSGTPPGVGKKQTGDGLSVKDLDIRKSFERFDWGDT